jgi:hypothetical protein
VKLSLRAKSILLSLALILAPIPEVSAADTRYLDVAQITWSGAKTSEVSSADVVNSIQSQVTPNWRSFTSLEGDTKDRSVTFAHGRTLESPIRLTSAMLCERTDFTGFMNSIRDEVYRQLGLTDWRDRYLIILTPEAGCIWSGRASIGSFNSKGGVMVLHNTASAFVITHELGHSLGLGHSNLLRCDSGASDGAWSRSCKAVEYGGSIDVMGNVSTTSPLSTYHQWRMGLLEKDEVKQSWLNESIDLSASDIYGGARAVFIRDGKSTYWIEYRRPKAGLSYNPGLVIYRTDPPSPSFIDSPNPDDRIGFEPGLGVSTDIWMLNLDTYVYSATGRASGSMTLAQGRTTTLYSGAITIEALAASSDQKITVRISRKADTNPPPIPPVTPIDTWRYPGAEILESGYDDGESAIASFEAQVDGNVIAIESSINNNFVPTYLDPFISRRAVYVRDLPEGTYSLSIRATDIWGNKSQWSPETKVTIDRGLPIVKSDALVVGAGSDSLQLSFPSIRDAGSNLCATQIVNEEGFILQRSTLKAAPEIRVKKAGQLQGKLQVFDCLGNGLSGDFSAKSSYAMASKSSKTGKWSPANSSLYGEGAISCSGKCSASFSTQGKAYVLAGEGEASVLLTGKAVGKIAKSATKALRTGAVIDIGPRKKVLRVTGSNFTLIGIASLDIEITNIKESPRLAGISDPSLNEPIQKNMARFGFSGDDFADGWIVLPMARGTTLDDPTLDLCSATYKSESGRQYRRQVSVSKVGTPYLFLSTEVVKYKDSKALDAALAELKTNYEACVKNKGGSESDGTFTDYTFTPLPISDAALLPEGSRVLVRAQIGRGASARQLLAFYQFKGEIFTGLYIVKAGEIGYSDSETKRWFDVAAVMATRLETKY